MARILPISNRSKTCSQKISGISLVEIIVGMLIAAILFAGIYQIMRSGVRTAGKVETTGSLDNRLARFVMLMTQDLSKAGSDPTGDALNSYQLSEGCTAKLTFKYGINPDPAVPPCSGLIGNIQVLSYNAYDADGNGSIDVEEGLDFVTVPPALRAPAEDNIVYAFVDTNSDSEADAVARRNYGNVDSSADDSEEIVLRNVVEFVITYYGFDDSGDYGGIISDYSKKDDIREVEVRVMIHADSPEEGYVNPVLDAGSPFKNYRTEEATFRVSLIVRKE